jgi:hypothetical protein
MSLHSTKSLIFAVLEKFNFVVSQNGQKDERERERERKGYIMRGFSFQFF